MAPWLLGFIPVSFSPIRAHGNVHFKIVTGVDDQYVFVMVSNNITICVVLHHHLQSQSFAYTANLAGSSNASNIKCYAGPCFVWQSLR